MNANPLLCSDSLPTFLGFLEPAIAPDLLYYTYIPAILISLFLGIFVFLKDARSLPSRILFGICTLFTFWVLDIFILWIASYNDHVMLGWQLTPIFEVPLFLLSIYFAYVLTDEKRRDVRYITKLLFLAIMSVMFLILPSEFNILFYDLSTCEGVPGIFWDFMYIGEIFAIAWIISLCITRYRALSKGNPFRKQVIQFGVGITAFLALFTGSNLVGQITGIQEISFLGSLGMITFLSFLVYLIVRYGVFNVKVFATQALVLAIAALIGAQLFLRTDVLNIFITAATFIAFLTSGVFLIKSVRREIEQRQLIEQQRKELEIANKQQESLLHFISHEIKGYLTDGQNAFAAIVEGDMGKVSPSVLGLSQTALGKMRQGVRTVLEILDASNMKLGTVSYKKESFNFRPIVESIVEGMRPRAAERGLALDLSIDATKEYSFTGDKEKIAQHIIRNLIDNAIRYTPKGSVHVALARTKTMILFSVKDTGVGITPEDKLKLFTEGGKGKDSIKVNVDSTGYGLFVAKQVVEAHGGTIHVESAGAGEGSEFVVELPAQ